MLLYILVNRWINIKSFLIYKATHLAISCGVTLYQLSLQIKFKRTLYYFILFYILHIWYFTLYEIIYVKYKIK